MSEELREHLRRTKAALNTALYWADVEDRGELTLDELVRRAQELKGCHEALDMAREALQ